MRREHSCGYVALRPPSAAVAWLALCGFPGLALAHGPAADVKVNPASTDIQSETTVVAFKQCPAAGAPAMEDVVLVAYNDFSKPLFIGIDRSTDGGVTFGPAGVPPGEGLGDPVLALGPPAPPPPGPPCGMPGGPVPPPPPVYLAYVVPKALPGGGVVGGIALSTSLDGGITWAAPANVSGELEGFQDKPWIDVDPDTGTPYVCWTQVFIAEAKPSQVRLSGGVYDKVPVGGPDGHLCQVQVGPGTVHLVWYQDPGPGKVPAMMYQSCFIAGPPCLAPVVVDAHVQPAGAFNPLCGRRAIHGPIDAPTAPTFTIHAQPPGKPPTFLVAWFDRRFGDADIVVRRSTDGGATWGPAARRVNDEPDGDQFMPSITAAHGEAKLQWYDRREDPANDDMRLWGALSKNGGLTWENAEISDVPFPAVVPGAGQRPCYMGDYNGITFANVQGGPHFLHVWGDNRSGDPDVFFDLQDPSPANGGAAPLFQTPSFSLRPGGPSSLPTPGAPFHPADLLRRVSGGAPQVGIACANLGLTADGCDAGADGDLDDLAGLSFGDDFQPLPNQPLLAFSVEPGAQGATGSAVALEAGCSPPEPQADEFASAVDGSNFQFFDGDGVACAGSAAPGLGLEETQPAPPVSDDLDALTGRDTTAVAPSGVPVEPIYFTLAAGSPSLDALGVTAGHLLRTAGGASPTVFAAPASLGLAAGDRIADFCLREDGDGAFGAGDLLFFTLAPGSPTLAALGATAADVLAPDVLGGAVEPPFVVVGHGQLGLLSTDVLDALKCELAWISDIALFGTAPPELTGAVGGGAFDAAVAIDRVNRGPAGTVGDAWLWVDPVPGLSARWIGEPGDECIGFPIDYSPDPVVDCSAPAVRGLHVQAPLPVGTSPATRMLQVTCQAPGTYTLTVSGGLRALEPPGARDLEPGNDAFAEEIAVTCFPAAPCPPGGLCFHTLTACRSIDTRQPGQGPPLGSGMVRLLQIAGSCGVPASAKAVAVNLTVVAPTGPGHLTAYAGDGPPPPTSTLNFGPGQTRANNAVLPLAANGSGTLAVLPFIAGGGQTHLLVDVGGYFE